jgi:NTP pyrophosphatase (non-canonical NTP hydrolase)
VFEPLTEIPAEQIGWSVHAWQAILRGRYGDKNKGLGIDNIFARLVSEIAEVIELQEPQWQLVDLDRLEEEYYSELADVFAWICAACSVMDIELQEIVLRLYSKGCSVCRKPRCECKGIILVGDGSGTMAYRAESVPVA